MTDTSKSTAIAVMGTVSGVPAGHITQPGEMTILTMEGRTIFVTGMVQIDNLLPSKVYELNVSYDDGSMWLTQAPALKLPSKIYDFEQPFRNQILKTLRHSDSNMNIGVLLEGYKGQGKSVIAKQLAIESGLPIVLVSGRIPRMGNFTRFLSQIRQDYCLFIDEFEKNFHNDDFKDDKDKDYHGQNSFLSLLDGATGLHNKRLTILTSNSEIGDKFMNRPSRVRYYKKFNFMNKRVFDAIVADKLIHKQFEKDLEDTLDVPTCTIDILTSIIEEINIQEKPYSEFRDIFNRIEKEVTYTIEKYNPDTKKWEDHDQIKTKREIGMEGEYFQHVFGYNTTMISRDDEAIIYEMREYIYGDKEKGEDEDKLIRTDKSILKATKKLWSSTTKTSTVFTV